ncbi:TATA element modulatory factor-like isoform X4 [Apis laboriosa]|uniref:TATA element modulatory factor-like isoform X4 n=1 Tax=Apis laboriosa TaxID=183418 RepID=UPI001CC4BF4B|nr:TATA element modulatory factor-like isoform X4 [Apis laboriosa]
MSWFDATGFANLAKSALKEAQKTIDKALDIKDEDQKPLESHTEDTSDFFASWGLKSDVHHDVQPHRDKMKESKQEATSSIWGSFTGSFFESPKFNEMDHNAKANTHSKSLQTTPIENEKKLVSSSSFSEDYKVKSLNPRKEPKQAEICKEKNIHDQNVFSQDVNTCNDLKQISLETIDTSITFAKDDEVNDSNSNINNSKIVEYSSKEMKDINNKMEDVKMRFEDKEIREYDSDSPISTSNRLSFVSPENDKKSLESVEILGSRSNTECSTSPDSDSCSVSNLASPATGTKVNSESVEILPDSLVTSPSSVEVLGDWKSDTSPYLSPIDQKNSDSSSILDRDDSVTPCWDDINVPQLISKENVINPSSSDISPYESPMEEVKTLHENLYISNMDEQSSTETYLGIESHLHKSLSSGHSMKVLSENVETISYTDEKDEVSLAEDSYTSTSESTVITMLETLQQKEQVKNKVEIPTSVSPNDKIHDLCLDSKLTLKKANTDTKLDLNLDSLTEKHNLHLPIEAITTQPIRKPEYFDGAGKISESDRKNFDRLINSTIEPAEAEHSIEITYLFKPEKIEVLDQVLISTDSSCEGTLIESSSEENPQLIHKSEGRVLQAPLNSSSYVKTMLEDAMIEKGSEIIEAEIQSTEMPRENSPISSESRSDLVKIGSDQTSGHTSGDELETTTSSDIEIISRYSPNGDSSSIQSRQNLAKLQSTKGGDLLLKTLKTKGHSRELSEISVGSDEANVEIEKLLKRIQEMTEILEARESKLIDVSRMNMELHEQNNNLKKQLDNFEKHAEQNQNINQITDEYTQRLSALERKFQQAIRERDSLRKNLEQLKVEAATRLSSQELSTLNAEKDEIIKELREEGEKLSKQQLQHSNIIKKLRVKEKENDALIKSQKEQIEEQISELERLKRSLRAKEEVELSQIDAVYSLTARTKTLEKEITTLQKQLENMMHNADTYKKNLDTTKMELSETKKILAATEVELKEATTNAGESCQLFAQVEDLKIKLRESEEMHVKKEEFLKHENSELLKRLEAAEARSEELSESVSMATKPLLRQLEQLQANLLHKSNTFMKQEKTLSEKNIELQTKIENLLETDRYLKEENINLKSKISQLEAKFTVKENERKRLQELYDELVIQKEKFVEQNMRCL